MNIFFLETSSLIVQVLFLVIFLPRFEFFVGYQDKNQSQNQKPGQNSVHGVSAEVLVYIREENGSDDPGQAAWHGQQAHVEPLRRVADHLGEERGDQRRAIRVSGQAHEEPHHKLHHGQSAGVNAPTMRAADLIGRGGADGSGGIGPGEVGHQTRVAQVGDERKRGGIGAGWKVVEVFHVLRHHSAVVVVFVTRAVGVIPDELRRVRAHGQAQQSAQNHGDEAQNDENESLVESFS